jgi:type IV secretory pathway VirB2 component (pilin)
MNIPGSIVTAVRAAASLVAHPKVRVFLRAGVPVLLCVLVIGLMADPAFAQGTVGTPSETPIDEIVTKLRNFLITILMPLVAALAIVWAAFMLYQGGREGMGNMIKVVGATLAALGAVGLVNLLQAFAAGQSR